MRGRTHRIAQRAGSRAPLLYIRLPSARRRRLAVVLPYKKSTKHQSSAGPGRTGQRVRKLHNCREDNTSYYHWPLCSSIPRERGHGPTVHGGPNKSRIGQAQWNSWGVGGIPFPPDRSDQLLTSPRSDQLLIPPLAGRREHTRLSTCATPIIVSAATATRHFPLPWSTASSPQVHKRIRDVGGVTGVVSARGAVSLYLPQHVCT